MLVLIEACTHNINLTSSLSGDNFILIETAVDNTIDNSRNKALTLLSQDIYVEIKSNFSYKEILNNNTYNTQSFDEIISLSQGYFKDLVFSKTQCISKDSYKTSVGLTKEAVTNTINYLYINMKFSSIDLLNKVSLEEELHKNQFLIALILFAKNKNIKLQNIDLKKLFKYNEDLNLRLSNATQITFNILPNLNNIAKINILNKDYEPNTPIFLAPGVYYYTVYAKGYKTLTNKLEVTTQNKTNINLYLQKLLSHPIKVKLEIISEQPGLLNQSVFSQVISIIEKYQLTANNYSKYTLKIEFLTPVSSMINSYYYNNLPINIILLEDNNVKLSQSFKITYVTSNQNLNIAYSILLSKLEVFLSELTAGNNLNQLIKY